jgi:integrase
VSRSDQRRRQGWDGAEAPRGASSRPEPGAGSAGRGAAQRRRLDTGTSPVTAAKAYGLLKAILTTGADDGAIHRNPCRIKGAGSETSAERPVLTVRQVFALSDAAGPRYRALVLLATFTSLRWGELCALRRKDVDLDTRLVRVERTLPSCRTASWRSARLSPPRDAGPSAIPD